MNNNNYRSENVTVSLEYKENQGKLKERMTHHVTFQAYMDYTKFAYDGFGRLELHSSTFPIALFSGTYITRCHIEARCRDGFQYFLFTCAVQKAEYSEKDGLVIKANLASSGNKPYSFLYGDKS